MYRQGDVLITRCGSIPATAKPCAPRERGGYVLAEGEATGHAHAVADDEVDLFEDTDGTLYMRVKSNVDEATVTHQEHGHLTLPRDTYKVTRQREYTPEAVRRVSD